MHGRFDLLLKLRARNLEQMRDILVNSVRKCSRVVNVHVDAKNHQGKTNRISDFSGGRRKALVLASLLVRRLPYGLPILFFFL